MVCILWSGTNIFSELMRCLQVAAAQLRVAPAEVLRNCMSSPCIIWEATSLPVLLTPFKSSAHVSCLAALQVLTNGITINDCAYHFLGHSNSQLAEKTCVLYACNGSNEAESFLAEWGNFESIRNPAKCAKRIGLLFSGMQPMQGMLMFGICDSNKASWISVHFASSQLGQMRTRC